MVTCTPSNPFSPCRTLSLLRVSVAPPTIALPSAYLLRIALQPGPDQRVGAAMWTSDTPTQGVPEHPVSDGTPGSAGECPSHLAVGAQITTRRKDTGKDCARSPPMCSTWLGWSRVLMGSPCTHTECPILLFLTGELAWRGRVSATLWTPELLILSHVYFSWGTRNSPVVLGCVGPRKPFLGLLSGC